MKLKFKILLSLILAFVVSSVSSNTVFIAGTPYINEPFLAELRNSPSVFFERTNNYLASIRHGKKGVEKYQQERVEEYVSEHKNANIPAPQRPEEFVAQGYQEASKGVYEKNDEAARTIYIHISADAKFEKKMITLDGEQVEAWTPL